MRTIPEASADQPLAPRRTLSSGRIITALLVATPFLGLACAIAFVPNSLFSVTDLVIALVLYTFTGFGISVGFHRLLTHRSFTARRGLKIVCGVAGSMALEGSAISWVAIHRRHHMFGDQPGDPHSPHRYGQGRFATLKGFLWAHAGWLFAMDATDTKRFAPDLHRDRDFVVIDKLFPLLAVASLALPFLLGWVVFGTLFGALGALIWAGFVRMAILHHVTWSVNSVCHLWGRQPFETHDHSTNVGVLSLVSFGESWHNFHHASPSSARHGVLPHQPDPSARLISFFERSGWVTKVRWPNPVQIVKLLKPGPVEEPITVHPVGL